MICAYFLTRNKTANGVRNHNFIILSFNGRLSVHVNKTRAGETFTYIECLRGMFTDPFSCYSMSLVFTLIV